MTEMPAEMMVLCPTCAGEKVNYDTLISEECEECDGIGELMEVTCPECEGQGCPVCNGAGELFNVTCPSCRGMGQREHHPECTDCNATGWRPHPDFMEVKS